MIISNLIFSGEEYGEEEQYEDEEIEGKTRSIRYHCTLGAILLLKTLKVLGSTGKWFSVAISPWYHQMTIRDNNSKSQFLHRRSRG